MSRLNAGLTQIFMVPDVMHTLSKNWQCNGTIGNSFLVIMQTAGGEEVKVPGSEPIIQECPVSTALANSMPWLVVCPA